MPLTRRHTRSGSSAAAPPSFAASVIPPGLPAGALLLLLELELLELEPSPFCAEANGECALMSPAISAFAAFAAASASPPAAK